LFILNSNLGVGMFKLILLALLGFLSIAAEGNQNNLNTNRFIGSESVDAIEFDVKKEHEQHQEIDKNVFHEWKVECKLKESSNSKHCSVKRYFLRRHPDFCMISVEQDSDLGLGVQFAFRDSPSVSGEVKVGNNKAEHFNEFIIRGEQAERILSQLKYAKKAKIKTHKWHKPVVEYTGNLDGFNEAYEEMLKQYFKQ
jgi:invasion protein IalB